MEQSTITLLLAETFLLTPCSEPKSVPRSQLLWLFPALKFYFQKGEGEKKKAETLKKKMELLRTYVQRLLVRSL